MQITTPDSAPGRADDGGNVRSGQQDKKTLLSSPHGGKHAYQLTIARAISEYRAPRHRHDIDQVYFPLDGEFIYGKDKAVEAGQIAYVPEGVHYGPQLRKPGLLLLNYLFGGASGRAYIAPEQRKAAIAALRAKGKLDDGVYTYVDAQGKRHNQDASEAVWEQAMGRKMQYPTPRYRDVIVTEPQAFGWTEREDMPGVSEKLLGAFTEREARLGFVRINRGATATLGGLDVPVLLFLTKGSVRCQDKDWPAHTAFAFDANEGPAPFKALADSELFYLQLHRI